MKILGVSGAYKYPSHDCSASLLIDGKLVGNYEEERFNRIKHSVGKFPLLSIHKLLDENNLKLEDIDAVGISIGDKREYLTAMNMIDQTCKKIPKFIFDGHHLGHICDTFYQSGFDSAAVVIIDGDGDEQEGITIAHVKNNEIKILKKYDYRKSLGLLYGAGAGYCGFDFFGEGKFMGLTSYGKDLGIRTLKFNNKTKDIDINYNSLELEELMCYDNPEDVISCSMENYFIKNYYPFHNKNPETSILYYIDFAKTIQENFNEIYLDVIKYAKVSVTIKGVTKSYVTDDNGQVKVPTKSLAPATYDVSIKYDGDTTYDKTSAKAKITVKKTSSKIIAAKKTFKVKDKTKKYTVTLKNKRNAVIKSQKVTITVGGKTYSAKTSSKGIATFKLTKLTKKGIFSAVVKFAGNKYYNSIKTTVKLTVKK